MARPSNTDPIGAYLLSAIAWAAIGIIVGSVIRELVGYPLY